MDAKLPTALRILSRDIYCEDGVATLCLLEAADEIERLRLTDAERAALRHAEEATAGMLHVYTDERPGFDISEKLRGLRERLG